MRQSLQLFIGLLTIASLIGGLVFLYTKLPTEKPKDDYKPTAYDDYKESLEAQQEIDKVL